MIIAIHQPNFIPWLGYFYKIYKSDVFVILDNVQFSKNSFINRNTIKTTKGIDWLTFPVIQSGRFGQTIDECIIFKKALSAKKLIRSIFLNYKKAKYFECYFDKISNILCNDDNNLRNINVTIIKWIVEELEIPTHIVYSSEFNSITSTSTTRLIQICQTLNGTKYLAGLGASKYQEDDLFLKNNIEIIRSSFRFPSYTQLWGEFVPNLSIIDTLFNCGPQTKDILHNS